MKSYFFLIISFVTFLISNASFGQEWEVVLANENVIISVAEFHFNDTKNDINHQRLGFKYENISDQALTLTFEREVNYSGMYKKQEQTYQIKLLPHTAKQYGEKADRTYYLFKKDKQNFIHEQLMGYRIINLKVATK